MPPRNMAEAPDLVRSRQLSPVDLTQEWLETIERLNPTLNAFITITAESALQEAQQAEEEIAHGDWRGPLHGIPIALKALIHTPGIRTTAASAVFTNRIPTQDPNAGTHLQAAGARFAGKYT